MNMPSYSGNAVHQIQAEHSSKSLEEFADALMQNDFVIVEEFYRDQKRRLQSWVHGNQSSICR